jgi:hypothetical protein
LAVAGELLRTIAAITSEFTTRTILFKRRRTRRSTGHRYSSTGAPSFEDMRKLAKRLEDPTDRDEALQVLQKALRNADGDAAGEAFEAFNGEGGAARRHAGAGADGRAPQGERTGWFTFTSWSNWTDRALRWRCGCRAPRECARHFKILVIYIKGQVQPARDRAGG